MAEKTKYFKRKTNNGGFSDAIYFAVDGVNVDIASSKKNLEETFNELETMYNIDDLEKGILEKL